MYEREEAENLIQRRDSLYKSIRWEGERLGVGWGEQQKR